MRQSLGLLGSLRLLASTAPIGLAALGVILCFIVVSGAMAWPMLIAWTEKPAAISYAPRTTAQKDALTKQSDLALKSAGERVLSRSPFYPLKPKVAEAPKNTPRVYGGPSLVAIYGDSAWFNDGTRLKVGDKGDGDLQIVELQPPWTATLKWRGGEFKVTLFEKNTGVLSNTGPRDNLVAPRSFLSAPSSSPPVGQPAGGPPPPPPGGPSVPPAPAPVENASTDKPADPAHPETAKDPAATDPAKPPATTPTQMPTPAPVPSPQP